MNVTKETVSPKKATEWLKRNVNNRPLRRSRVERLAEAVRAGEWQLNGETVKFNGNGDLVDGQHRLNACVLANMPFETYVVRGVPHSAFDSIDTGAPRFAKDAFARQGEKYYSHLASAVRYAYWLDKGQVAFGGSRTLRNSQSTAFLAKNPQLRLSVEFAATSNVQVLMSISMCAALHYQAAQLHGFEKATAFWKSVATGEGLSKSMPAYELRSLLIKNRSGGGAKYDRLHVMALSIKAWNAFAGNVPVKCLRWASDEAFPVIQ